MINGIINIYKEKGYTSHDVVARLRGMFKMKKIGHTGTLDPDAVGVLPVCFGSATKLCDMMTDKTKEYCAQLLLGIVTDTQDISGKIIKSCETLPSEEKLIETIMSFKGEYMQVPPMYSAIKIKGQKLVDLARQGIEVERQARRVEIFDIIIENIALPIISIRVNCSKGTYIRTLCHDIGLKLGVGACMKTLSRTRAGEFKLESAVSLDELNKIINKDYDLVSEYLISTEDYFNYLDSLFIKADCDRYLQNGNKLKLEHVCLKEPPARDKYFKVYDAGKKFKAIYQYVKKDDELILYKNF